MIYDCYFVTCSFVKNLVSSVTLAFFDKIFLCLLCKYEKWCCQRNSVNFSWSTWFYFQLEFYTQKEDEFGIYQLGIKLFFLRWLSSNYAWRMMKMLIAIFICRWLIFGLWTTRLQWQLIGCLHSNLFMTAISSHLQASFVKFVLDLSRHLKTWTRHMPPYFPHSGMR